MKINKFFFIFGIALISASHAYAEAPRLIAQHEKWGAYIIEEKTGKVCYMAGKPEKQEGVKGKSRGEVYALITSRPAENSMNVFSYVAGYTYKPGGSAILNIDGKAFTLFTKDDTAWAKDNATDKAIADAIKKGSLLKLKGISSHGTHTLDIFSLKGSSSAMQEISRECSQ